MEATSQERPKAVRGKEENVDRREELMGAEAEGWAELSELLARLSAEQMVEPGLTEDWNVKDLLAHIGAWLGEAAKDLDRIRQGTYDATGWTDAETDAANLKIYKAFRDTDLETVRRDLFASREAILDSFGQLSEVTGEADNVLRTEGPEHYADHLVDLRRFVARVTRT